MGSITAFMYHDVRDLDQTPFPRRYLQKSFLRSNDFLAQLDYVRKNYIVISLEKLLRLDRVDADYAILTFDDGLRDHFTVAQHLHDAGMTGAFFLPVHPIVTRRMMEAHQIQFIIAEGDHQAITDYILSRIEHPVHVAFKYSQSQWKDNYWTPHEIFITRFLREYPDKMQRRIICMELFSKFVARDLVAHNLSDNMYLTITQIGQMKQMGMAMGGHGYWSENLCLFDEAGQRDELMQTKDFLESVGVRDLYLSYPHGGVNASVLGFMEQLGYKLGFVTQNKVITDWPHSDLLRLPRIDAPQLIKL